MKNQRQENPYDPLIDGMGFFSRRFEDVPLLVRARLKVSDQFTDCLGVAGKVMLAYLDIIEG